MPLSLSDDEYAAVQAAAAPIHRLQRAVFLKALADELERHPVVGLGLVHRLAADLQKRFGVDFALRNIALGRAASEDAPGGRLRGLAHVLARIIRRASRSTILSAAANKRFDTVGACSASNSVSDMSAKSSIRRSMRGVMPAGLITARRSSRLPNPPVTASPRLSFASLVRATSTFSPAFGDLGLEARRSSPPSRR